MNEKDAHNKITADGRNDYDVAIVGAGPAGTSAAIHLALGGRRVVLFEAKRFPRHKLCGEFISPECVMHFRRLGVEANMMDTHPARITETVFYTHGNRRVVIPSMWFGGGTAAIGLSRSEMDARLLARARAVGVEVHEATRATGVVATDEGIVCGVQINDANGAKGETRAAITLDATGRAGSIARAAERLHTRTRAERFEKRRRAPFVAFKAHLIGARASEPPHTIVHHDDTSSSDVAQAAQRNRCEIYFYPGGYGGLNEVECGVSNLCFIVDVRDVRRCGGDAERIMREVVFCNNRARQTLVEAQAVTPWLSVALERFGRRQLTPAPGLLAIGDAASFIDPFTGSGILMALESGEIAAEVIAESIFAPTKHQTPIDNRALNVLEAAYAERYRARFERRLRICSVLRRAAFAPSVFVEVAAAALGASVIARRAIARMTRGAETPNDAAAKL